MNDRQVDETGDRQRYRSSILPPYVRRSAKVSEVLRLLYLHGLSSGDILPGLKVFFGTETGLSSTVLTALTMI